MLGKPKRVKLKRHIALELDPEFHDRLKRIADTLDRSISYVVRAALNDWVEANEEAIASPTQARDADTERVRGP